VFDIKTLSIIATLITSLVSFGTLWNVRKQRLNASRPDIYVKDRTFTMNLNIPGKIPEWGGKGETGTFSLPLYNIGLGTAKKIQIKWELEEDYIIKVKQLDKSDNYHIEHNSLVRGLEIYNKENKFFPTWTNLNLDLSQKVDFILPYNSNTETIQSLVLPWSIMELYGIHMELFIKYNDLTKLESSLEDIFSVEISYFDVNNKKYKKHFKVSLVFASYDFETNKFVGYSIFT
jgi:hypothetical protein